MKEIQKRYVNEFLDVIILSTLNGSKMCGMEIIAHMHKNFKILFSPGTVYPLLHSMKEGGLVTSMDVGKKKMYKTTKKGEAFAKKAGDYLTNNRINHQMANGH